jgi:hypothetical protein
MVSRSVSSSVKRSRWRVPAGPLDVLAHDHGEPGVGRLRLGQQVRQPAVAGDADLGEQLVRGAVAALLDVQPAGLDVPVPGGDEPSRRQLGLHPPDLAAHKHALAFPDVAVRLAGSRVGEFGS